ncbi:MAG: zinc ribbon domain-containing protein [Chloroflexi bacterium]|nr:zinc ribbon domain-containing protein [Chloroflexota bacterium]MCI0855545.1 zinc ribbon domain-containing protein [Chloroflexota bacterium]MCI0889592.1 zinc ribbon domain-containing protein [Chloroflexota bacterium]
MPLYEYHCPSCRETFELLRPMQQATEPATCPSGHPKAGRVLSLIADPPRGASAQSGGGGCPGCAGGACSCAG